MPRGSNEDLVVPASLPPPWAKCFLLLLTGRLQSSLGSQKLGLESASASAAANSTTAQALNTRSSSCLRDIVLYFLKFILFEVGVFS
jgi:hypothetical protein